MSYSYEDYVNYYKYYYGDQYGTYYAQQAAAAAGVQAPPAPGVPHAAPPPPVAAAVPPPTQNYSYPPPAAAKVVTYPPPASYNRTPVGKRSWSEGVGGAGAPASTSPYPKKPKKPPVPSVTCAICDVTVSSEQVYLTHIAGKAHKKKADKMKKDETAARAAPNSGSAEQAAAAAAVAAALPPQPAGTGIIISGGAAVNPDAAAAVAAATAVTLTPPEKPKRGKKGRNKPNKKRSGFGLAGTVTHPSEQVVFQCELCNVTVNSQQQLDLHLTGIKHKKTVRKMANSSDPEVQRKLKEASEMAAKAEQNKANGDAAATATAANTDSAAVAASPPESTPEDTAPQPNLPPGYIFIPAAQSESGKDTFLCSACQHYSSDLFSLNAHVSSAEHQTKSAQQEQPLGVPAPGAGVPQAIPQAKLVGQKTNFNLGAKQTSNANSWNASKVPPTKKIMPLSSSFVAASSK